MASRALWNGAITFGLVHVPVGLHPMARDDSIDFDWIDAKTLDPVGYKRVNKRTGKEIGKDRIVRGVKHGEGYVLLDDDEIRAAYPRTTQTIEIEAFVDPSEIPFVFLERPYVLAPLERGEKVYALLREALFDARKVGIARVVVQTRQHLAALAPSGSALILNTLRWGDEIRSFDEVTLPPAGRKSVAAKELQMASKLVDEMSSHWNPDDYPNNFRDAVMALVEKKAKAGATKHVEPLEEAAESSTNVVDLSELLRQSLKGAPKARKRA